MFSTADGFRHAAARQSRTLQLGAALVMHRRIVVLACAVDAGFALLLVLASMMMLTSSRVSRASDRSEFVVGMLLTGVGASGLLLAALFIAHAYWCWHRLRKLGPRHRPRFGEFVMLLFAPLAAAVTATVIALRLVG